MFMYIKYMLLTELDRGVSLVVNWNYRDGFEKDKRLGIELAKYVK